MPRIIWHTGKGLIECSSVVIHRAVSVLFSSMGSHMLKLGQGSMITYDGANTVSSPLPPALDRMWLMW